MTHPQTKLKGKSGHRSDRFGLYLLRLVFQHCGGLHHIAFHNGSNTDSRVLEKIKKRVLG